MALNQISNAVVGQVLSRLSNPTTGFNPGIIANAANYGIPANFIKINWGPSSNNFVVGQIDPELVEKTGILTYPFVCLYVKESANQNIQKFNQFSGLVRVILEIHLSFVPIKGIYSYESYLNCCEDVVYDVINRVQNQNWTMPVVFNGQIRAKRNPLVWSAQNWKQILGFEMLFEVHQ